MRADFISRCLPTLQQAVLQPKVLVGFAGRRVIQDTIKQKLPDDFQTAEFLLESGFVDAIADRRSMRKTLSNILRLHNYKKIGADWQHG